MPYPTKSHVMISPAVILIYNFPDNVGLPTFRRVLADVPRASIVAYIEKNCVRDHLNPRSTSFNDGIYRNQGSFSLIEWGAKGKADLAEINAIVATYNGRIAPAYVHDRQSTADFASVAEAYFDWHWTALIRECYVPNM